MSVSVDGSPGRSLKAAPRIIVSERDRMTSRLRMARAGAGRKKRKKEDDDAWDYVERGGARVGGRGWSTERGKRAGLLTPPRLATGD